DLISSGTKEMGNIISGIVDNIEGSIGDIIDDMFDPNPNPDPEPEPDPDPPDKDDDFYFPVNPKASGINFWSPPHSNDLTASMDYGGNRAGGRIHAGYDIGGGGRTHKVYAVRSGKVTDVSTKGARGFT